MTSQTSSTTNTAAGPILAMQKQLTKNRIWVIALSSLLTLIYYAGIPAIILMGVRQSSDKAAEVAFYAKSSVLEYFGFNNPMPACGATILALLFSIQGFAYLYNMRSVVFFDSQPVSKNQRFVAITLNGILLTAVITALGNLLALALVFSMGGGFATLPLMMFLEWLRTMLLFIALYAMCILGAVLSGNVVIAFLMTLFLNLAELGFRLLKTSLKMSYFTTIHMSDTDWNQNIPLFSPLYPHFEKGLTLLSNNAGQYRRAMPGTDEILRVFGSLTGDELRIALNAILFLTLAYLAFRKRPAEASLKALAFPLIEWIVKICTCFILGACTWLLMDNMFSVRVNSISIISVVTTIIVVAVTAAILEVIFAMNISCFNRRWGVIPGTIAGIFLIFCLTKFDAFGYDRYVPDSADVESCAFYLDNAELESCQYYDEKGENMDADAYFEKYLKQKDTETICEIARIGMKNMRKNKTSAGYDQDQETDNTTVDSMPVTVLYRMKNGKKVWRDMSLPLDTDTKLIDRVITTDEYIDLAFCISHIQTYLDSKDYDYTRLTYDSMADEEIVTPEDAADVKGEDLKDFLECYRKDLADYSFEQAARGNVIGKTDLSIEKNKKDIWKSVDLYYNIQKDDTNTIQWMKKHGTMPK